MMNVMYISKREVWVVGEVLEAEVEDEAINDVVNVEKVKPLNHIWGEAFVTDMKLTKFKRA